MHETLLKEINEMLSFIAEGKSPITHMSGGGSAGAWRRVLPSEVRADVTRAVRETLLERREDIRKENARRLLEDDAREFRAVLNLSSNDKLEIRISDGKQVISVSGTLAEMTLRELKQRAGARLELTLESLAALDDDEEDEK